MNVNLLILYIKFKRFPGHLRCFFVRTWKDFVVNKFSITSHFVFLILFYSFFKNTLFCFVTIATMHSMTYFQSKLIYSCCVDMCFVSSSNFVIMKADFNILSFFSSIFFVFLGISLFFFISYHGNSA